MWPDGVVGAITHCAGFRAAAVAWRAQVRTVGLDAEPHTALPDGVLEAVSDAGERALLERLAREQPEVRWDKILFSAKESVYKAWFPLTGRWLGFEDAELDARPRRHLPGDVARARSGGRRRRDHRVQRALGGTRRLGDHGHRRGGRLVVIWFPMANEAYWERYESVVEQRIRDAQDEGAFENLRGAGRPLRGLNGPHDENWWLRSYLEREGLPNDVLLPTPLRLRREIDRLPETVRDMDTEREVRDTVAALARRVAEWLRFPDGPQISVRMPRADDVVEAWRAGRRGAVVARAGGRRTCRRRGASADVPRPSAWARVRRVAAPAALS